jgi:hypothetical protein
MNLNETKKNVVFYSVKLRGMVGLMFMDVNNNPLIPVTVKLKIREK